MGGQFTTLCGQSRNRIGRLNEDGSLDTSFNPGVSGGSFPRVASISLQADQKILVGGWFTAIAGQNRTNIGRLNADGSLDSTFTNGTRNVSVFAVALQADGKVLLGGNFTNVAGQLRNNIARLNNTDAAT